MNGYWIFKLQGPGNEEPPEDFRMWLRHKHEEGPENLYLYRDENVYGVIEVDFPLRTTDWMTRKEQEDEWCLMSPLDYDKQTWILVAGEPYAEVSV